LIVTYTARVEVFREILLQIQSTMGIKQFIFTSHFHTFISNLTVPLINQGFVGGSLHYTSKNPEKSRFKLTVSRLG